VSKKCVGVINERGNRRENIPLQFITKITILLSFISASFLLTFCSHEQSNQKFSGFESIKHQRFKIIDFEGSTSIRDPWSSYIEAKRWENHWCDKLFGIGGPLAALSSLRTYSWESAGYVASAIWDLYDDMTEADKNLWKVCKWNDERYEYVYTY